MSASVDDSPTTTELILCDTFVHVEPSNFNRKKVKINLYNDCLKFFYCINGNRRSSNDGGDQYASKADKQFALADLAGSSIGKSRDLNSMTAFLTFYAYPKHINKSSSSNDNINQRFLKRNRVSLTFSFNVYADLKRNLNKVNEWHLKLDFLLKNDPLDILNKIYADNSHHDEQERIGALNSVNINQTIVESRSLDKKSDSLIKINASEFLLNNRNRLPYMVIINPNSGAGKAKSIFNDYVLPVWSEANVNYVVVETKYAHHATDLMRSMSLNLADYRGIIVVSGDGVVYEVLNGIINRPDWQTAIKTPVSQLPGGSANAFACTTAYLGNECFASLNQEQFTKTMAFFFSKARSTPMDLMKFQLCDENIVHGFLSLEYAFIADVDLESEMYRFMGNFRFTVGAIVRLLNLRIYRARFSFLAADPDYRPKNENMSIKHNKNNINSTNWRPSNLEFDYLPKLNEPVPDDWSIIEDEFILFLISNLPMIGPDFLSAPEATFNDGYMHVLYVRKGTNRMDIVKFLLDTSTDEYYKLPFIEHVKIKAFRLEPLDSLEMATTTTRTIQNEDAGVMMVDGERVKFGPIQGEIRPGMANALA